MEYFHPPPQHRFIYSAGDRVIEVTKMTEAMEIEDCSWREVYYLNGCHDQLEYDIELE